MLEGVESGLTTSASTKYRVYRTFMDMVAGAASEPLSRE